MTALNRLNQELEREPDQRSNRERVERRRQLQPTAEPAALNATGPNTPEESGFGRKAKIKLAILGFLALLVLMAVMGIVRIFSGITSSQETNEIFNAAAELPPDLLEAITWEPDAPDLPREMEPLTRIDVSSAWVRAWEQLTIAAQTGDTSGMEAYFSNSALEAALDRAADMGGRPIHQLSHRLRVDFYSQDGQVIGLTAPEVRFVRAVPLGDEIGWLHSVESYEAVLLLEDGNFRIQHWVRREVENRWWTEPVTPGTETERLPVSGVNYYPQATPFEFFWPEYDPEVVASDLDRIVTLGADSIRIFLPFDQLGGRWTEPEDLDPVLDLLDQADERDLGVVVTLFDGRTDHRTDKWDSDRAHLATVVPALAEHPALVLWDVKNEPDRDIGANSVSEQLMYAWLGEMAHQVRSMDEATPITIGWSTPQAALAAPIQTDVVSYHYYGPIDELAALGRAVERHAEGRPVLLTEYGLPTWNSIFPGGHTESEQAAYVGGIRQMEDTVGIDGSMIWTLWDLRFAPVDAGRFPWSTGPQTSLGLLRPDGSPKPAAAFIASELDSEVPGVSPLNRLGKRFWQMVIVGTVLGVAAAFAFRVLGRLGVFRFIRRQISAFLRRFGPRAMFRRARRLIRRFAWQPLKRFVLTPALRMARSVLGRLGPGQLRTKALSGYQKHRIRLRKRP